MHYISHTEKHQAIRIVKTGDTIPLGACTGSWVLWAEPLTLSKNAFAFFVQPLPFVDSLWGRWLKPSGDVSVLRAEVGMERLATPRPLANKNGEQSPGNNLCAFTAIVGSNHASGRPLGSITRTGHLQDAWRGGKRMAYGSGAASSASLEGRSGGKKKSWKRLILRLLFFYELKITEENRPFLRLLASPALCSRCEPRALYSA